MSFSKFAMQHKLVEEQFAPLEAILDDVKCSVRGMADSATELPVFISGLQAQVIDTGSAILQKMSACEAEMGAFPDKMRGAILDIVADIKVATVSSVNQTALHFLQELTKCVCVVAGVVGIIHFYSKMADSKAAKLLAVGACSLLVGIGSYHLLAPYVNKCIAYYFDDMPVEQSPGNPHIVSLITAAVCMACGMSDNWMSSCVANMNKQMMNFPRMTAGVDTIITGFSETIQKSIDVLCDTIGVKRVQLFAVEFLDVSEWMHQCADIAETVSKGVDCNDYAMQYIVTNLVNTGNMLAAKYVKHSISASIASGLNRLKPIAEKFPSISGDVGFRMVPVGLLICGEPGIGKSWCVQLMSCGLVAACLGEEHGKRFMKNMSQYLFVRNPDCEFWDGYFKQFITFYDDFLQKVDVAGAPTSGLLEVIQAAQGFPMHLPMARLERKEGSYFGSSLVIATTNIYNMSHEIVKSVHSPMAVARRWDINVDLCIRAQYCVDDSVEPRFRKLRSDLKAESLTEANTDYWEFLPYRVYEENGRVKRVRTDVTFEWHNKKVTRESLSFLDMMAYMKTLLDTRMVGHRDLNRAVEKMVNVGLNLDEYNPDAVVNQNGDEPEEYYDCPDVMDPSADLLFESQDIEVFTCYNRVTFTSKQLLRLRYLDPSVTRIDAIDAAASISLHRVPKGKRFDALARYFDERALHLVGDYTYGDAVVMRERLNPTLRVNHLHLWKALKQEFVYIRHTFVRFLQGEWQARAGMSKFAWETLVFLSKAASGVFVLLGLKWAVKQAWNLFARSDEGDKEIVVLENDYPKLKSKRKTRVVAQSVEPSVVPACVQDLAVKMEIPIQEDGSVVFDLADFETILNQGGFDRTGEDIALRVRRNVFRLRVEDSDNELGAALGIEDRVFMMPMHFITRLKSRVTLGESTMDSLVQMWAADSSASQGRCVAISDILNTYKTFDLKDKHCDVVLFQLPRHVPQVPSIVKYFLSKENLARNRDWYVHTDVVSKGSVRSYASRATRVETTMVSGYDDKGLWHEYAIHEMVRYMAKTKPGDCGSPCFLVDPTSGGQKLIGIHVAGSNQGCGFAAMVSGDRVKELLNQYQYTVVPQMEDAIKGFRSYEGVRFNSSLKKPFEDVNFRSVSRIEPSVHLNRETRIGQSELFEAWCESKTIPARMRPFEVDGVILDPLEKGLAKYGRAKATYIRPSRLAMATRFLSEEIRLATLGASRKRLSFEEAMLGVAGEEFLKGVSAKSSPGFPWKLKYKKPGKTDFVKEGAFVDGAALKNLKHDVEELERRVKRRERPPVTYLDFFKDERRPVEKVMAGKTRMISASPLDYTVVVKQYFGSFASALMAARLKAGYAVGMNVYSEEWNELAVGLLSRGAGVSDGDFSGYDTSQSPQLLWAVFDIIQSWYDDEESSARETLWNDVVGSRHVLGENVYEMVQCLPSGHPLTTIINSILSRLAYVLCWLETHNDEPGALLEFRKHVYLVTYGDDSIYGVTNYGATHFNESRLPQLMANIGFTYTTAQKDGVVRELLRTLDQVTFLKRGFRFEECVGRYVCPLALDVSLEMPFWYTSEIVKGETLESNVRKALEELSLHGPEVWNQWATVIANKARSQDIEFCVKDFALKDSARQQWVFLCLMNIEEY